MNSYTYSIEHQYKIYNLKEQCITLLNISKRKIYDTVALSSMPSAFNTIRYLSSAVAADNIIPCDTKPLSFRGFRFAT